MSTDKVGLFGGSFDPVHNAHLALAYAALAALKLDHLRWIPAGQPWQKSGSAMSPAEHREAMVRLAIAAEPRFVLDRIEIERPGPSYTLDTVRELTAAHPGTQWFLILGHDQYAGLHTWGGWRELLGLVTLAVANRPGAQDHIDPAVRAFQAQVVPLPMLDVSATVVRQAVASGADISKLVPAQVARYIEIHGLYRGPIRS
ncbi:MAG TPA: nicotinate-nucleotide adenylyltransferase [Rubrivivax sp.]|nr:nicotinate-nucleotide adenylyltransferase [Rubrivivax sp.]